MAGVCLPLLSTLLSPRRLRRAELRLRALHPQHEDLHRRLPVLHRDHDDHWLRLPRADRVLSRGASSGHDAVHRWSRVTVHAG